MNHYTQALADLKAQSAHKLGEVGDQWQTPPALFWGVNAVFGPFVLDLFTDGENSKCPKFYTVEDNALLQDWTKDLSGGKAFANPPYSRSSYDDDKNAITGMRNIMAKVTAERDKGAKIVLLLKSATSEVWWPENADHVAFVRGRISFDLPGWFIPASDKDKASSAGFAVAICVFDKDWRGQPMQYIERDTLLAQGNAILQMIELRANQIAQQRDSVSQPSVIQSSPEIEHKWSFEVTNMVDQALVDLKFKADPEFHNRLCSSANRLLLTMPDAKFKTMQHIKLMISDRLQQEANKTCAA